MFVIYPYKLGSASAKALRNLLQEKTHSRIRLVKPNGTYRPKRNHRIITWGMPNLPRSWRIPEEQMINHPDKIRRASNKILAFTTFTEQGLSTVEWTTQQEAAQAWINDGHTVVARNLVSASGGRGITLHGEGFQDPLPRAPLYTKYKKKKKEYRVHVFNGEVIDVVQKKKRRGTPDINTHIRNIGNGWVFAREGLAVDNELKTLACQAVVSLGLEFGAVDIIYNERENKYFILEVNTAPGIEGTTLQKYAEAFYNAHA